MPITTRNTRIKLESVESPSNYWNVGLQDSSRLIGDSRVSIIAGLNGVILLSLFIGSSCWSIPRINSSSYDHSWI